MNHNKTYIEELIRKQLLGQLTEEEAAVLDSQKSHYSEADYDWMVVEILRQLEGQLPEGLSHDWKPDFEAIRVEGDRRRKGRNRFGGSVVWWAAAAVFVPLILITAYQLLNQGNEPDSVLGACAGISRDIEIPVSESAFTLSWGDTGRMDIQSDVSGELLSIGELLAVKDSAGMLKLSRIRGAHTQLGTKELVVSTGYRQQCVVELPDGTLIRLNAKSVLYYPIVQAGANNTVISVAGEAYVQSTKKTPLIIRTGNAVLSTMGADFALLTGSYYTRAVLEEGEVSLHRGKSKDRIRLHSYCEQAVSVRMVSETGVKKDSLIYTRYGDMDGATRWTRAVRHYRNVPLRTYVYEMSRWHGFRIKDMNCIPAGKRISTEACYKESDEEVYSSIRQAGITVYQENGMLSFCPEEERQRVAVANRPGKETQNRSFRQHLKSATLELPVFWKSNWFGLY